MIDLQPCPEGVLLPVRAQPGSRRNQIRGEQDGMLKVSVTQIAEKGKANEAIRRYLAKSLGLRLSQVELHAGATTSQKKFLISNVSVDELRGRIQSLDV